MLVYLLLAFAQSLGSGLFFWQFELFQFEWKPYLFADIPIYIV